MAVYVLNTEDEIIKPILLHWDVLQLLQSLKGQEKQSSGKQKILHGLFLIIKGYWGMHKADLLLSENIYERYCHNKLNLLHFDITVFFIAKGQSLK